MGILSITGLGALLLIPFLIDLGVQKFPEFLRGFLRVADRALGAQRADFVKLNAAKAALDLSSALLLALMCHSMRAMGELHNRWFSAFF